MFLCSYIVAQCNYSPYTLLILFTIFFVSGAYQMFDKFLEVGATIKIRTLIKTKILTQKDFRAHLFLFISLGRCYMIQQLGVLMYDVLVMLIIR